jgi:hypothetical protein
MSSLPMDEWLKALEDAQRERPASLGDGLTVQELRAVFGVCPDKVRSILVDMIRIGKVIPAKSKRMAVDGQMRYVPVYVLRGEGGKL